MHIICPHCTTSYAIDPATLGAAGRTVRCSRCKEVWLARPEDAVVTQALVPSMAENGADAPNSAAPAARSDSAGADHDQSQETPVVESPSISAEWPAGEPGREPNWPSVARPDAGSETGAVSRSRPSLRRLKPSFAMPAVSLTTICAAMGALVLGLGVWRADVVRLLPQ